MSLQLSLEYNENLICKLKENSVGLSFLVLPFDKKAASIIAIIAFLFCD